MRNLLLSAAVLCAALASIAHAHDEVLIGHDGAGKLQVDKHFDEETVLLYPSFFPGIPGFAGVDPGLTTPQFDEPEKQLFMLASSANIEVMLLSSTLGAHLWNENSTAPLQVGQTHLLGSPYFHVHAVWNVEGGAIGSTHTVTLMARDKSGLYADSEPFDVTFTLVPEPATAVFSLLLGAVGLRRR